MPYYHPIFDCVEVFTVDFQCTRGKTTIDTGIMNESVKNTVFIPIIILSPIECRHNKTKNLVIGV